MKQNPPAEETKSQVDKQPSSKPASPAEFPLWLVTSFVLGLASLVSLVYYFFVKRSKAGGLRREDFSAYQPPEQNRRRNLHMRDWTS